jgi:hypothetical protein
LLNTLSPTLLSVPAALLHRDTSKDAELLLPRHKNTVEGAHRKYTAD